MFVKYDPQISQISADFFSNLRNLRNLRIILPAPFDGAADGRRGGGGQLSS
jgi:hypothetical protein